MSSAEVSSILKDEHELARLGYKQELKRDFSPLDVFSLSLSCVGERTISLASLRRGTHMLTQTRRLQESYRLWCNYNLRSFVVLALIEQNPFDICDSKRWSGGNGLGCK